MRKSGVPYFPLDVTLDTSFELIEAEFGIKGFGVIVKLFQLIYGEEGYYAEWTNEVRLLFAKKNMLSERLVSEIVERAVQRGIFDKDKFDQYQVLTSRGIQSRYLKAVGRRQNVELKSEYLLLCNTQIPKNVNILLENADILSKNAYISKQSKVKKSKVEKSKENNNTAGGGCGRYFSPLELMENIKGAPLTEFEIRRLADMVETYSEQWTLEALEIMGDNGKVKISYAEGILKNWQNNGKVNKKHGTKKPETADERIMTNATDYNDIYRGENN